MQEGESPGKRLGGEDGGHMNILSPGAGAPLASASSQRMKPPDSITELIRLL